MHSGDAEVVAALARTEAVRADRRLHADEKRIRTQSTILWKNNPKTLSLSFIGATRCVAFLCQESSVR
jgi:hypothetical protein